MNKQNNTYININGDFAVAICGDRLVNFGIHDGDIVTIRRLTDILNGSISLVEYEGVAMLTKIYQNIDKDRIMLQSGNPKYPPIILVGEEKERITIIGKAISIIRNIEECEGDNED